MKIFLKGGFLGLAGVQPAISLPIEIIYSLKTLYFIKVTYP